MESTDIPPVPPKRRAWSPKKKVTAGLLALAAAAVGAYVFLVVALGIGFPNDPVVVAGPNDKIAQVLGSHVRYREVPGTGVPLLFLPGNGRQIEDWDQVMAGFPGRHMYAMDLIGYAGSGRPEVSYTLECHAQYVAAFMDALKIDQAVVIGHSVGGPVAAWVGAKWPERVRGVVIVAPPGVPGSLYYPFPKSLFCHPGFFNRLAMRVVQTKFYRKIFPLSRADKFLGVTGSFNEEYVDVLGLIKQPTLLLWSPGDIRCDIAYAPVYQRQIKDLEFISTSRESEHMIPLTDPAATIAHLKRYLPKVDARDAPKG